MYPSVCANLGVWSLLIAERLEIVDVTDEVRKLLADASVERCLDANIWHGFIGLVQLEPDGKDILPARGPPGRWAEDPQRAE